ncbi:MAG TPA: hypothetical protein VKY24_16080 [Reyranella sp.]|nr:hypothetical protein [Reyranella sp.]
MDADGIGILAPKSTNPPILCAAKNTPIQGVPQMPEMPLTLQGEREAGRAHGLPARRHSRARTAKQLVNWNADLIAHRFYRALRLATYYGQWLSLFSGKRGLKVGSNVQGGLSGEGLSTESGYLRKYSLKATEGYCPECQTRETMRAEM